MTTFTFEKTCLAALGLTAFSLLGAPVTSAAAGQASAQIVSQSPTQTTVSGTVVDESGEPLIGASVLVEGAKSGTTTDVDGKFQLSCPAGANITISYV
ncbi:MAG: carboxypeptidase-like regulatory domain-containing protein, partial [Muribaculaceae bacterium]|nr:carboxypeptidase-like regulatory domain-containing protein [Muribaculaceae bacterium]